MIVVYIDSVFCLNALMDTLLIWVTGQLAGRHVRGSRCALAGILGGCYAAVVFLPGLAWLSGALWKLLTGVVMLLIAFGGQRHFLRLALLFLAVSCGMAGCVMGIGLLSGGVPMENGIFYTDIDARVLLTAAAAAYAVLSVVFRAAVSPDISGVTVPVVLEWRGNRVELRALCDTGNSLRDAVTGRPILVAEAAALSSFWPRELRPLLMSPDNLRSPAAVLSKLGEARVSFRLVPYRAVGVEGGLLLAVRTDRGEVNGKVFERLLVALSPTELGAGYTALWGETERGDAYEAGNDCKPERACKGDAGTCGHPDAAGRSLHRRQ